MSDDNRDRKLQTGDLRNTKYGETWAASEGESISQTMSEILRAAMQDGTKTGKRAVLFYLAGQPDPIVVSEVEVIRIGRSDGITEPTIDLNQYNGAVLGVSRNHAEIVYNDGQYFIKDVGSRNGTYVNEEKIPHYKQMPLKDADQLRLGHFSIIVRFSKKS